VLALHSLNHHDNWLQLKLKYFMQSNFEVWLSSDRFSGDALSLFGQFDLNHHDNWLQLKLKYFMQSNFEVWLSSDRFSGDAVSLFGQFDERDRFSLGFELGF